MARMIKQTNELEEMVKNQELETVDKWSFDFDNDIFYADLVRNYLQLVSDIKTISRDLALPYQSTFTISITNSGTADSLVEGIFSPRISVQNEASITIKVNGYDYGQTAMQALTRLYEETSKLAFRISGFKIAVLNSSSFSKLGIKYTIDHFLLDKNEIPIQIGAFMDPTYAQSTVLTVEMKSIFDGIAGISINVPAGETVTLVFYVVEIVSKAFPILLKEAIEKKEIKPIIKPKIALGGSYEEEKHESS